ncbi:hypothetical protein ACNOIU_10415 [Exiguobacterium mexicanum]|uniref:Uncharacterized protein n=1 Tax=Exiguobacterium mexicanum TaxID=340146 RepID=A0ABT7MJT1_9BACL|nr:MULTISPECIES: hypothetical protein [Exiguobacterium]MDL5375668.1 hypothetical protein [Exiguobacterium mexicanum]
MTLILPECITGFSYGDCPVPEFDNKSFQTVCFDYARRKGGTCNIILGDSVTPNYDQATITIRGRSIYVLLSRVYPIIGISKFEPFQYEYIDVPELTEMFPDSYQIPSAAELNERFDVTLQPFLNKAERGEINYWQPKTIGNVIFHYWD